MDRVFKSSIKEYPYICLKKFSSNQTKCLYGKDMIHSAQGEAEMYST